MTTSPPQLRNHSSLTPLAERALSLRPPRGVGRELFPPTHPTGSALDLLRVPHLIRQVAQHPIERAAAAVASLSSSPSPDSVLEIPHLIRRISSDHPMGQAAGPSASAASSPGFCPPSSTPQQPALERRSASDQPTERDAAAVDPSPASTPRRTPSKRRHEEAPRGSPSKRSHSDQASRPPRVDQPPPPPGPDDEPAEEWPLSIEDLARPEMFSLNAAVKTLQEVELKIFEARKAPETSEHLFSPSAFFRVSEIAQNIRRFPDSTESRLALRIIQGIFRAGITHASPAQKERLFIHLTHPTIASNAVYTEISEMCFTRYFRPVPPSPSLKTFCSSELIVRHILHRSQNDIHPLAREVQFLAQKNLREPHPIVERLYHCTKTTDQLLSILKRGVQVTHEGIHPGAFFSTQPEERFGAFAVTIPVQRLGSNQSAIHRFDRQPVPEGSHIWIGSTLPVQVLPDRVLHSPKASTQDLQFLRFHLPHTELISMDVQRLWDKYAREISWVVPIPTSFDPRKLDLIHLSPDA
jgi:hypothetical protein